MKKLTQMMAVAATAFALCLISLPASAGAAGDQKIATVNLAKVFDAYYKTVRFEQSLKQEAADMQKDLKDMVDAAKKQKNDWEKLIDKANDQAASAEERAKNKKAAEDKLSELKTAEQSIQAYDRACDSKLQEKKRQRHDEIVKEIRSVLNADAKAGGYTLVFDVSGESANMVPVVIYSTGTSDLTENLIKELNAGISTTPADKDTTGTPAK